MNIGCKKSGDIMILDINGRVIGDACLEMRRTINGWLAEIPEEKKPKVVINLDGVTMMDSGGLGMLVASLASIQKRDGRLVLSGLGRGLQNLIAITRLATVFDVYKNEEEAIKSFQV